MKRVLLVAAIASVFSSVAFADFTIASSKKLDARVDVVGAKNDQWCETNLSLKFLTTGDKDLSQTAYDELYPKVQSLISSQCAKATNVVFFRGSEKISYLVKESDWQVDSPKAVDATTKAEVKPETKVTDKDSKKESKNSLIAKESVQLHLSKLVESLKSKDASYLRSMTNKDFFVKDNINGDLKRDEYIVYLNGILNKKFNKIEKISFIMDENIDFWNNKHHISIEGIANENGGLAKYKHNLTFSMFKNSDDGSYFIDRLEQKTEVSEEQIDSSGKTVVNVYWDYTELLAYGAKSPIEIEGYINSYIISKDKNGCDGFRKNQKNFKGLNDFVSSYEKNALEYKKMVESTKEAKFKYKASLKLNSYDEKNDFYIIEPSQVKRMGDSYSCSMSGVELKSFNIVLSHNVKSLKIPIRLANMLKNDDVTIEIVFEPNYYENKLHVISSKYTKIIHESSGTVLFDAEIPSSIYKKEPFDFMNRYAEEKKAKDAQKKKMSASDCETMRFMGFKCD